MGSGRSSSIDRSLGIPPELPRSEAHPQVLRSTRANRNLGIPGGHKGRPYGRRSATPEIPGSIRGEIASIGENEVLIAWRDEEFGFAHLSFHALEPVK